MKVVLSHGVLLLIVIILLSVLLYGCRQKGAHVRELNDDDVFDESVGKHVKMIAFKVQANKEVYDTFKDGIISWVELAKEKQDVTKLIDAEEVVLENEKAFLVIDYPVNKPCKFELHAKDSRGFTRAELVNSITSTYEQLYKEEEETAEIKTVPMEKREGIINRNKTNGKYGIWGHDLSDLALSKVNVIKKDNGEIYLYLMIES